MQISRALRLSSQERRPNPSVKGTSRKRAAPLRRTLGRMENPLPLLPSVLHRRAHMLNKTLLIGAAVGVVLVASGGEAAPMSKCIVNGTVTYQQGPCPSDQRRKRPTLEELNAEAKARRAAAASARHDPNTPTVPTVPRAFSCDGRQYCSQMRSCEEAKYFVVNCPGVKMDGDRNGITCEKQWCNR
jgi:hypothetical protein